MKRVLDLVIGVPASIVAAPVLLVLAALIIATCGWPPFIVQTRVGADERPIRVLKLRSMRRGTPTMAKSELVASGLARDPSLYTPLGPFLRRSSLDELPQILHVITGSMSLVGPRPALPTQTDLLELRRRTGVTALRPGLTGLAQINGRESMTLSSKVRFETLYTRHASACFDIVVILRTIPALLSKKGAY